MTNFSFRWGVDIFDNDYTQIPNWVLACYNEAGITNTEMMFIIHLASFKYESASSKARPSLTKTLRERMGYKSNQGIINVQEGLVKKGLLIVDKRPGQCSVYDFTPFSKKVVKIALANELNAPAESSTKLDDSEPGLEADQSTKLDDRSSTKLDGSRQQNLTRRRVEEENIIKDSVADAPGKKSREQFFEQMSAEERACAFLEGKVEEVKSHLEDMPDDMLQIALEKERVGKNRISITRFIEARLNKPDSPDGNPWGDMFKGLADCCDYDTRILTGRDRGQLANAARTMLANGYCLEDIQGFRPWWDKETWQGQKGQPPKLGNVREEWGRYRKSQKNGHSGSTYTPNLTPEELENYHRLVAEMHE